MSVEPRTQRPLAESLAAFERKLLSFFTQSNIEKFVFGNVCVGLEKQGGDGGETTVALLAQEMRDFCVLEHVPSSVLDEFARFLAGLLESEKATRMRIGPLGPQNAELLCSRLRSCPSNFIFQNVVLSVEPLLDKASKSKASKQSLRRALGRVEKAGLTFSREGFSPTEMSRLHEQRWGNNRAPFFFEFMKALDGEPYCDCVSLRSSEGELLGQQIDFCFFEERYYYYSAYRRNEHPGLGTALLAESLRQFYDDPFMRTYSFGRGGEEYKYRYANCFRLNHYIAAFRTNNVEQCR